MKVTPLNPQFIVGTPEATEEARPPADSEPHLRIVPPEASASSTTPERPLDRQTQDALRRLSRFLRKTKPKNERALKTYSRIAHILEDQDTRGLHIDEKA